MHSGQSIRQANHQRPLTLDGLEVGQVVTLTPLGAEVGKFIRLPIDAINNDGITVDGHEFLSYNGSLVKYNGKLHTLDLPEAQPAVA